MTKKARFSHLDKKGKDSKIKMSVAILGGGDVVFPIIATLTFIFFFLKLANLIFNQF